jgi:hypothetical protein
MAACSWGWETRIHVASRLEPVPFVQGTDDKNLAPVYGSREAREWKRPRRHPTLKRPDIPHVLGRLARPMRGVTGWRKYLTAKRRCTRHVHRCEIPVPPLALESRRFAGESKPDQVLGNPAAATCSSQSLLMLCCRRHTAPASLSIIRRPGDCWGTDWMLVTVI